MLTPALPSPCGKLPEDVNQTRDRKAQGEGPWPLAPSPPRKQPSAYQGQPQVTAVWTPSQEGTQDNSVSPMSLPRMKGWGFQKQELGWSVCRGSTHREEGEKAGSDGESGEGGASGGGASGAGPPRGGAGPRSGRLPALGQRGGTLDHHVFVRRSYGHGPLHSNAHPESTEMRCQPAADSAGVMTGDGSAEFSTGRGPGPHRAG